MRGKEHIHHTSHISDTAPTLADHLQPWFQGPSVFQFDPQLTRAVYTGDPRLCSQPCEIRRQHIPTFAGALLPRPSIFCFLFCDSSQESGVAGSFISTVLPISHIPRHAFWSSFQPAALLTGASLYQLYTAHCERWAFHTPSRATPRSFPSNWAFLSVQAARAWRAPIRVAAGKYLPLLNQTLLAVAFKFY